MEAGVDGGRMVDWDIEADARRILARLGEPVQKIWRVFPDHVLFTRLAPGKPGEGVPMTAWLKVREGYREPVVRLEAGWPLVRGVLFPDEEGSK